MRISDWSSDVCSSDLLAVGIVAVGSLDAVDPGVGECRGVQLRCFLGVMIVPEAHLVLGGHLSVSSLRSPVVQRFPGPTRPKAAPCGSMPSSANSPPGISRSAELPSELQSLMRISYAVFCSQKKNTI